MPRSKTEALVELSSRMEEASQLELALAVIDARFARKGRKAAPKHSAANGNTPAPVVPDSGAE